MLDNPITAIIIILNSIALFVGAILYFPDYEEKINFRIVIVFQKMLKDDLEHTMNHTGILILQIIISIVLLPYTVVMTALVTIKYILEYLWNWYKYIFRKRNKE